MIHEPESVPSTYRIRRLKCLHCNKIHHELPDFIVPYKRYSSDLISNVIEGNDDTRMDPQQIKKLHHWFALRLKSFVGLVRRAFKVDLNLAVSHEPDGTLSNLDWLKSCFHHHPNWLAHLVRLLVNLKLWPHTRSVWLSSSL